MLIVITEAAFYAYEGLLYSYDCYTYRSIMVITGMFCGRYKQSVLVIISMLLQAKYVMITIIEVGYSCDKVKVILITSVL